MKHPVRTLRELFVSALRVPEISVEVGGLPEPLTVLEHPPSDGWVSDELLPAAYVFVRSERVEKSAMRGLRQRYFLVDVIIQGAGGDDTAVDQVDDAYYAIERAVVANQALVDFAGPPEVQGSEITTSRGEVVFASRRVSFEITLFAERDDPAVVSSGN